MNSPSDRLVHDLHIFLTAAGILTLLGLVFVYSASSIYALERLGSAHYFFAKHVASLLIASAAGAFFYLLPSRFWQQHASLFFGLSLGLTALVLVPSLRLKVHGAARWIRIGGFSFQPSEFLKLFSSMYLGAFLAKREFEGWSFWRGYLPLLIIFGFAGMILLKQPDFGSTVILFTTLLTVCFVARCTPSYLLGTLALAVPAAGVLIYKYPYRLQRLLTFANPWADRHGKGFQMVQSLIAIGSGGWWGTGVAYSKQKFFYLPMQHTDFIFSIIAEEVGFIGCILIMLAYLVFAAYGLRLVLQLRNVFAAYMTLGFVVCIMLQVVLNMMVATGLVPTKGLGLPFISFGGSSLLVLGCMLGLIANCVYEQAELNG